MRVLVCLGQGGSKEFRIIHVTFKILVFACAHPSTSVDPPPACLNHLIISVYVFLFI